MELTVESLSPLQTDLVFVKTTLVHSPIITALYPNFKVCTTKPLQGPSSASVNDEADQYVVPPQDDLQLDVFDDDLFMASQTPTSPQENLPREYTHTTVVVKLTSILVDDVEWLLNAAVRHSCLVPGLDGDEDLLLVSVRSGFLFLVRLFPVRTTDSSLSLRPYIVQWWDVASQQPVPSLETPGATVHAHALGLCCVAVAAAGRVRILPAQLSPAGPTLGPHFTLPGRGAILHSCFASPVPGAIDSHYWFLTMEISPHRRLELHLFLWLANDPQQSLALSCLPLYNTFEVPVFVVPLPSKPAFLFVSPKSIKVVSVGQIQSGEFDFPEVPFDGFPTSFFVPDQETFSDLEISDDTVLVACNLGVIYAVLVSGSGPFTPSVKPMFKIADPISVFSLSKLSSPGAYHLLFGSDTGSNRELLVTPIKNQVLSMPLSLLKSSQAVLVKDYKNWTPVLDVAVVDAYNSRTHPSPSTQELWMLTGSGKRTRLTQLRRGFSGTRRSKSYDKLRKVLGVWPVTLHDKIFLVCSTPFGSSVLELQEGEPLELFELEDAVYVEDEQTLLAQSVQSYFLQVTTSKVILSNLQEQITLKNDARPIICACVNGGTAVVVVEESDTGSVQVCLFEFSDKELDSMDDTELFTQSGFSLLLQVTCVECFQENILVGTFGGSIHVFSKSGTSILSFSLKDLCPYKLHDSSHNDGTLGVHNIRAVGNNVVAGTKDGFVIQFSEMSVTRFLKLADCPVLLSPSSENCVLVICGNLWLLDVLQRSSPRKIYLQERMDRSVLAATIFGHSNNTLSFATVRSDGLTLHSLSTIDKPVVRQINLLTPSRKLIYLSHLNIFMIMSKAEEKLRFIDRKSFKMLPLKQEVFAENEEPLCACVWSVDRGDRVSKKLLVGCLVDGKGSFKILNTTKTLEDDPLVRVTELTSFLHPAPITHIQQIRSLIIFSSGCEIYSTSYDTETKKLRLNRLLQRMPSEVTSLSSENDHLWVSTKLNSATQFFFVNEELQKTIEDLTCRSVVNAVSIGDTSLAGDKLHSTIFQFGSSSSPYKVSGIPRIYKLNFQSYWTIDDTCRVEADQNMFLSVGINGEITVLQQMSQSGTQLQRITEKCQEIAPGYALGNDILEKTLNRPFENKITGKGLRPLHRPYFDYYENKRAGIIDLDLEEFSSVRSDDICF